MAQLQEEVSYWQIKHGNGIITGTPLYSMLNYVQPFAWKYTGF